MINLLIWFLSLVLIIVITRIYFRPFEHLRCEELEARTFSTDECTGQNKGVNDACDLDICPNNGGCGTRLQCVNGECVAPIGNNDTCTSGTPISENNPCKPVSCTGIDNRGCGSGLVCTNDICVRRSSGPPSNRDCSTTCNPGLTCYNGECSLGINLGSCKSTSEDADPNKFAKAFLNIQNKGEYDPKHSKHTNWKVTATKENNNMSLKIGCKDNTQSCEATPYAKLSGYKPPNMYLYFNHEVCDKDKLIVSRKNGDLRHRFTKYSMDQTIADLINLEIPVTIESGGNKPFTVGDEVILSYTDGNVQPCITDKTRSIPVAFMPRANEKTANEEEIPKHGWCPIQNALQ